MRALSELRLVAFILLVVGTISGLVVVLSFGVHSFVHFIGNTPSPRRIPRVIFCLILILGLTGASRGVAKFYALGDDGFRDRNLGAHYFYFEYEKVVRQTTDSLILFGGALLFLWLL
jgi:hypothetical protein